MWSQWPLRPLSLRQVCSTSQSWRDFCLNGLCGRCRCDSPFKGGKASSLMGLNGLCGRCRCDKPTPRTMAVPKRSQWPLRPLSLRQGIEVFFLLLLSQWPLRPLSLRLWRHFSHTRQTLATPCAGTSRGSCRCRAKWFKNRLFATKNLRAFKAAWMIFHAHCATACVSHCPCRRNQPGSQKVPEPLARFLQAATRR